MSRSINNHFKNISKDNGAVFIISLFILLNLFIAITLRGM